MPQYQISDVKRYGIAILAVAVAIPFTFAVERLFGGRAPLLFFVLAVIVAGAYGIGPGSLATGLGVASILLFFAHIFTPLLDNFGVSVFAVVGAGISLSLGRLYRANVTLRQAKEELQQVNGRLSQRGEALVQSNRELQRFAYTVAHDLNTPVRTIGTMTELLLRRSGAALDDSSQECARLIVDRAQRMQEMIQGLLEFAAAVESPAVRARVEAGLAMEKAMRDLDGPIQSSSARITVDALPAVLAAESQLVLVFSNLIGNAIKYCRRGTAPEIAISASEDGGYCRFCVADQGIGIDAEDPEEVFRMFKRLHGDEYEGTGVGLALCKAVVERSGGKIWFESEAGKGTKFYFTLPR